MANRRQSGEYSIHLSKHDLTCPVCYEIFKDPLLLPCGHSLCSTCVAGLTNNQCPLDRRPFQSRERLQTNMVLRSVLSGLDITAQESAFREPCGQNGCSTQLTDISTVFCCKSCENCILCVQCFYQNHRDSDSHDVEPLQAMLSRAGAEAEASLLSEMNLLNHLRSHLDNLFNGVITHYRSVLSFRSQHPVQFLNRSMEVSQVPEGFTRAVTQAQQQMIRAQAALSSPLEEQEQTNDEGSVTAEPAVITPHIGAPPEQPGTQGRTIQYHQRNRVNGAARVSPRYRSHLRLPNPRPRSGQAALNTSSSRFRVQSAATARASTNRQA